MTQEYMLSFEREVDVPAARLYAGWTDPDMILKWFTPEPWRTTQSVIEMRPGGAYYSVMVSPDGREINNQGCVLEFEPEKRFVFTNMMTRDFMPKALGENEFGFVGKLSFEPTQKGAHYRAAVYHEDQMGMDMHASMGFEEGWNKALDQLVALIKREMT